MTRTPLFEVTDWSTQAITTSGDATSWAATMQPGDNRWLNDEQEAQYYVSPQDTDAGGFSPFFFHNRNLVVEAVRRAMPSNKTWASGAVDSNSLFQFQYGTIEYEARFPKGLGMRAALWLASNPYTSEVDVAEPQLGNVKQVQQTVHGMYETGWATPNEQADVLPDITSKLHKYTAIIAPDTITFMVDDQQTGQFPTPPDLPKQRIIANLGIGAMNPYPGIPAASQMRARMVLGALRVMP